MGLSLYIPRYLGQLLFSLPNQFNKVIDLNMNSGWIWMSSNIAYCKIKLSSDDRQQHNHWRYELFDLSI